MFRKKTVLEVLDTHNIALSDEMVLNIRKSFNRVKCKSKIKELNYRQICHLRDKNINSWVDILQGDKIINSPNSCWQMNPFEDAIIIVTTTHSIFGFFWSTCRVFIYRQAPFSEVIILPNLNLLEPNFNLFNVYLDNGSLLNEYKDLVNPSLSEEIICISKDTLHYKYCEEEQTIRIIMRFYRGNF